MIFNNKIEKVKRCGNCLFWWPKVKTKIRFIWGDCKAKKNYFFTKWTVSLEDFQFNTNGIVNLSDYRTYREFERKRAELRAKLFDR